MDSSRTLGNIEMSGPELYPCLQCSRPSANDMRCSGCKISRFCVRSIEYVLSSPLLITTFYPTNQSRSCQEIAWPKHKRPCGLQSSNLSAARSTDPSTNASRMFFNMQNWAAKSVEFLSALATPTAFRVFGHFHSKGFEVRLMESSHSQIGFDVSEMTQASLYPKDQSYPVLSLVHLSRSQVLGEVLLCLKYGGLVLHVLVPLYWAAVTGTTRHQWGKILDLWICYLFSADPSGHWREDNMPLPSQLFQLVQHRSL